MSEIINTIMDYVRNESWVIHVFFVVFITLLANYIQVILFKRIHARLEKTANYWDDALVGAASKPLTLFIWIVGLCFAAEIVAHETDAVIFSAIDPVRDIGVIISLTWFLVRFIKNAEENIINQKLKDNDKYDRTTADAIAKLLRISVVVTAFLVLLQTLGYNITGVLAFGGVGGIAVGFAAKDLLANFFGGLMIYLDRPFNVGDWVRSPNQDIEGTVEEIGWRLTKILTFDKRPLYVPNSVFNNISVENPSRMTNRRIYETVGIRYGDATKMAGIVADVKKMLQQHPEIDTNQTMIVNFNKFSPSSLDFFVYTFTRTTEWIKYHEIKQDVMLKIIEIIDSHGAECAFPTSTVHIQEGLINPKK